MIETAVIAACYVTLANPWTPGALAEAGSLAAGFAPVLLVAYVTTMFSADIRYGLNKAKLLSETDELTGLYNMRGFAIVADRSFGQALRYERPATVLMIDSDNLKTVNDTLGHEAGNELLRHLARCIQGELRYTDVSARYGGDEFIVLLPETPLKGALDVADRIRRKIVDSPLVACAARGSTRPSASASPASPPTAAAWTRSWRRPTGRCTRPSRRARTASSPPATAPPRAHRLERPLDVGVNVVRAAVDVAEQLRAAENSRSGASRRSRSRPRAAKACPADRRC